MRAPISSDPPTTVSPKIGRALALEKAAGANPQYFDVSLSQRTVIIAVIAVLVVQTSVDQIIGMIAVRDLMMAAILVAASALGRRAIDRVGGAHCNYTLVVVVAMGTMQVAVVQVIDVAFMLNAEVPAMLAVRVSMSGVCSMLLCSCLRHSRLSFLLTLK